MAGSLSFTLQLLRMSDMARVGTKAFTATPAVAQWPEVITMYITFCVKHTYHHKTTELLFQEQIITEDLGI